ncbi:leucyl aminopeptidase family protein [Sphingomonas sanguinis]|jgi:leucyl aminopeptidase|uniref:Leucyl aminopeptidase family protein n=1 Tax=Sphingomonas sanguinis TaxID=33051 RepID=A0A7Y7QS29_9SPHN|nr:leucyl aminopeptidase family protein [Sphingomonas sanguinis]MBZ6380319.1 leucyl aminopeptidase family protein [Sphingomonas sanguinis]NNG48949.1 leucyl aminopeptidase family protein [Sphingomonas sanguinis]NNG52198.1 leucyl aminopeptidase family protein [Sphingomonas sanguinis]NVP29622.1 leucyl aminopeptidase family protein [Sphingomonas sanguinis]
MTDVASLLQPDRGQSARTITLLTPETFDAWLNLQSAATRALATAQRFTAKPGTHVLIPDGDGIAVIAGVADASSPWALAKLAEALPEGSYRLDGVEVGANALGWLLGQYRFTRYRKAEDAAPRVLLTRDVAHRDEIIRIAAATAQVRDLVNSGAGDLGPAELEAEAQMLARAHHADVTVISGEALARDYPMIHAVGQAAIRERAPRLIELHWGDTSHPRIAIVGKGVCFDTGGLDIKPSAGMRLMKKDMGGAAHALALAGLVMAAKLPVRLHLLIPAVENAISGAAFRPGDVLRTRKGLTVENTNTDAEGRLILGDALTRAGEDAPELILDFATLTGAARVALGPDLPPLFTDDEALAADLLAAGVAEDDPVWRMPLWDGYDDMLKSDIADMVNAPDGGFAGAITAALFLRRFVPKDTAWAHLDVFAWRPSAKPGRPKGGDAYALRATYAMLKKRYSGA